MKFLFIKKKQDNDTVKEPNAIAKGLQAGYDRLKTVWATWMTKRTAGFSPCTWKVALGAFMLFTSGYSIYLAANAVTSKPKKTFNVTSIKKPAHTAETGEVKTIEPQVSEAEYSRIKKFRVYMDSLARSPSGKITYDSIIRNRPGLIDSVQFIEQYYEQQKIK